MGGSRGIIGIPDTGRNASPHFRVPRLANALMTISCKSYGTLITSNFVLPRRDRLAEQEATGRRAIRRVDGHGLVKSGGNRFSDQVALHYGASRKESVHLEPVRRL